MITIKMVGGTVVVSSNRVRIGYINKGKDGLWIWELILLSEQFHGHPRGISQTNDEALSALTDMFLKWCKAAGLKDETNSN